MEVRIRHHNETYRWLLAHYNPLLDDQGQVVRWYVACTDIEDHKKGRMSDLGRRTSGHRRLGGVAVRITKPCLT